MEVNKRSSLAVMASSSLLSFLTLSVLFNLTLPPVSGELVFEDGYTVTTVIDGDKVHLNPQLILAQFGSSDFVVLDSTTSTFYTVSFPFAQESVIKRLTGNGEAGYTDGDLGSASFSNPKSFAIDFRGNIYVADKKNHAIRKISQTGVTTIAGGYTQKTGRADGPARNATFSNDFELVFAPEQCALMVTDRGTRLVRQINLKAENCRQTSENVLGTTFAWALGLLLSCLLGLTVGFFIRPYVFPQGGQRPQLCKETWNRFLINLGRQVQTFCFDIKSAVVSSPLYSLLRKLTMLILSHLALMFRFRVVELQTSIKKLESLLDVDSVNSHLRVADHLRDLITFDEGLLNNAREIVRQDKGTDVSPGSNGKIDDMIQANIVYFAQQTTKPSLAESSVGNLGSLKRRCK